MEKILVLQYPIGVETITLDQLLEWELWPCFIKIFSKIQCCMSNKSKNNEYNFLPFQPVSQKEPRQHLALLSTAQF